MWCAGLTFCRFLPQLQLCASLRRFCRLHHHNCIQIPSFNARAQVPLRTPPFILLTPRGIFASSPLLQSASSRGTSSQNRSSSWQQRSCCSLMPCECVLSSLSAKRDALCVTSCCRYLANQHVMTAHATVPIVLGAQRDIQGRSLVAKAL